MMINRSIIVFRYILCCLLLPGIAASVISAEPTAPVYSRLWGQSGEKFDPFGRMPDYSFAGYHFGEEALPHVEVATDVTRFGAIGDGNTDCTPAFIKAIETTKRGAITIPPGRYLIRDILWIRKPNIVLRGAGPEKTVLHILTELQDVRPNMGTTTSGRPTSNYSWSGGFLWLQGRINQSRLAQIITPAARGSHTLILDKEVNLKAGQRVQVAMKDNAQKSLLNYLYSGDPGDTAKINRPVHVAMVSRVLSVAGKTIILERPLWFDVRPEWKPQLMTFQPTVSEVGIEDLAIEFPVKPYAGHFTERGMNGIAMTRVADCWVRNVRISNSDSGLFLGTSCTAKGLVLDSQRTPDAKHNSTGHHGISLGRDCLLVNFDIRTRFIHDITVGNLNTGNVVKNGSAVSLSLDHHKRAPYQNLFCNLDVGDGKRLWNCGGGAQLGKHCGARTTFWAIRSQQPVGWPPDRFGPDSMTLVGFNSTADSVLSPDGRWFEIIDPYRIKPADLHAAQLTRRLAR